MKELDKEQLEAVKSFFLISSDLMVNHLKEKGLIKEELKVGKWYISETGTIAFIDSCANGKYYGYGLNNLGDWINDGKNIFYMSYQKRIATRKEVEEALIKEAKKRGFKEGVRFESAFNGDDHIQRECLRFNVEDNTLVECREGKIFGNFIFHNGKWATIIEEKKLTLEERIEILENK